MAIIVEMSAIEKAEDLAQAAHVGQKRKKSKLPYIIHPFRLYQSAKKNNLDKESQILALLHDVYEDTDNKKYIVNQIRNKFGDNMLKLVLILSHDKSVSDYNSYVYSVYQKSSKAFNIKLLDMIENLKDNPSEKQINKYYGAIKYLLDKGVNISNNILSIFKKINKNNIYI